MVKHLGLKAYGKINLGLDVLRKREDGYHEVRMVMQTVGLYDRIDLMYLEQPGIKVETNSVLKKGCRLSLRSSFRWQPAWRGAAVTRRRFFSA